jgi:hypothetical protein
VIRPAHHRLVRRVKARSSSARSARYVACIRAGPEDASVRGRAAARRPDPVPKATRQRPRRARVATKRTVFGARYHSPGALVEEFATKDPQHDLRLHGIDRPRAVRPAHHSTAPSTRPAGVGGPRAARAGPGRALMEAVTDFSREPGARCAARHPWGPRGRPGPLRGPRVQRPRRLTRWPVDYFYGRALKWSPSQPWHSLTRRARAPGGLCAPPPGNGGGAHQLPDRGRRAAERAARRQGQP